MVHKLDTLMIYIQPNQLTQANHQEIQQNI